MIEIMKIGEDSCIIEGDIIDWLVIRAVEGRTTNQQRRDGFRLAARSFVDPLNTRFPIRAGYVEEDSFSAPHLYNKICHVVESAEYIDGYFFNEFGLNRMSEYFNYEELLNLIGAFNVPFSQEVIHFYKKFGNQIGISSSDGEHCAIMFTKTQVILEDFYKENYCGTHDN